ncbi:MULTISPECIES: NAD(P)H-dependent flavin oxidoreductase [Bacillaceae]|uniref:Probable nitronate monooxygenase n=1 Tax=Cytobacillus firmus TaxID=1399 RepID=A0AA46P6D2_CYTFI|nr:MULTISPECIES: nitronate monooxygenase [Bacillaceae]KML40874.1 2-nitropropane dioxygenase [Cytobacillus firmus]MBY6052700.1 nitronate monooxygenase [Cytobacillus firmus]MCC3646038.1 nitronate monooxygenase [Cytobacillus oceanisediminis]MCS0652640.1 nitronate monooxygenase [Cytobacillus firmus]MCU1804164.1 nitronate monooxygenase [Cytobacillus firmus]
MNRLTDILNIKYPIIQGGMGNISNAILTAAVSEAGGLGTIGAGTMLPEDVERIIEETKSLTDKPFAVNVALSVSPYVKEILSLVIKHKVPAVSLSAGNPAPFIPKLHENGVKVITVAASVRQAMKAEAAGADIIAAEGYEAAGINSALETTTLVLIPQIIGNVAVPVVAAGGIGDGKGLAAMLALGASGVQMGTRFIATKEAPFHPEYKKKIIEASDHETLIVGRSVGRIRRVLSTGYANKLLGYEKQGISIDEFNKLTSEDYHKIGAINGNGDEGFMNSGQIAGLISDLPSVKELLDKMIEDADLQLQKANKLLN